MYAPRRNSFLSCSWCICWGIILCGFFSQWPVMVLGASNAELVRALRRKETIKSDRVERAMLAVDRGYYSPHNPYFDSPQSIGYSATISAPHMILVIICRPKGPAVGHESPWNHAYALEYLKDHLTEGKKALDVGSGSGYLTACMAIMVGPSGKVVGIDHIPELVNISIENVRRGNPDLLNSSRMLLVAGDGRQGYPAEAPYDAIHVGAAAPTIPQPLLDQLKRGGRMVIPVGPRDGGQWFKVVDKSADGTTTIQDVLQVVYVPLTDRDKQWSRTRNAASQQFSPWSTASTSDLARVTVENERASLTPAGNLKMGGGHTSIASTHSTGSTLVKNGPYLFVIIIRFFLDMIE